MSLEHSGASQPNDTTNDMAEFGSRNALLADFVVSVYVLGPLVLAPASELYGRAVVYYVCNAGFAVFSVACGLQLRPGHAHRLSFLPRLLRLGARDQR
ncbi:MFS multidrug transporter [Apiospora phragmitis]|uniref:MFS multidrug transporter n=1 Tax=Apiospora phragmitis TaxID=2905665 RepID=A0ABR1VQC7_9PEZI